MTEAAVAQAPTTTAAKKAAPEVETVVLKDGRSADFPGKRKLLKESFIDDEGTISVRMDFRNGETRTFVLPPALIAKFAAHGAEQKLGDETAGLTADVDDMVEAVDQLMARLNKGEWTQTRDASGLAGSSVLLRALVEAYAGKKTAEEIRAFLETKTHEQKMALRQSEKLRPIIQRIEAEKAAKATGKVDTAALLDELG